MTRRSILTGLMLGVPVCRQAMATPLGEEGAIDGEGLLPLQGSNQKMVEDRLGIQILSLRLTSADSLLGLRFRVVDAEKAAPLFDRDRPHMIHEASGVKLRAIAPATDVAAAPRPERDGCYAILFGNVSRKVKHGDRVTVLVGDFRLKDLVVFASVDPAAF